MVLLGLAVRHGTTPVDDWFQTYRLSSARWLYYLVDRRVIAVVLIACVGFLLYRRRWQLAAAAVFSPIVALALVELFKPLLGREKEGGLAYPSGHMTVAVVVLGVAVLAAGLARWAVIVAVAWCLLGMVGLGVTFHYFTDTVGAVLLGTSVLCVAALILRHAPRRT
jgi:hypothetical protein